ncbi:hypothetical protein [Actinocrispum sp. NPDC049592]|uniref:hypothetical protein n=1 Tax=Actinocrispum sp. NPDC049592 TaxID=3154835 RepID=UPI00342F9BBF
MPTRTFDDKYTLTVGDHHLQLSYPGNNHEAGNILIEVPRQRAAVMVDVVLPGWAPFRSWGTGDSIPGVDVFTRENVTTVALSQMLDAPKALK